MNVRAYLIAQAVRGPVLLITLGVLFAMHQAGVASFERTWPLILIVLGVMKLIERMVTPPGPPIPPGAASTYPGRSYATRHGAPPPPPGGPQL